MEKKTPFKELSASDKIQYIWDYYKVPIFIVIIVIFVVVSFVRDKMSAKESVLGVLMINCDTSVSTDNSTLFDDFLIENNFDTASQEIELNNSLTLDVNNSTNYQQIAALTAYFSANEYNICFMDDDTFSHYSESGTFCDITEYLDDELLEKYNDDILYATLEDGTTYAAGIELSSDNCQWLADSKLYDSCIFSVCYTNDDTELVKKLCNYIL